MSTTIEDYLVLASSTSSKANNIFTWNIPNAYYSDQRSTVCKVELIQLHHTKGTGHHQIAYVATNLGVQNQYCGQLGGRNILGVLNNNKNTQSTLPEGQCMSLLTPARPSKIQLTFWDGADPTNATVSPDSFVATLKFSYFSPIETSKTYLEAFTPQIQ